MMVSEHPRVCGENGCCLPQSESGAGTSPRMRGKLHCCWRKQGEPRNIPAYAGKTPGPHQSAPLSMEHPRVCGENGHPAGLFRLNAGTSPRMRGKQRFERWWIELARNIPAYAGKTNVYDATIDTKEEHPRVCGENAQVAGVALVDAGTSPRMRGKLTGLSRASIANRNIPAYAGKTKSYLVK